MKPLPLFFYAVSFLLLFRAAAATGSDTILYTAELNQLPVGARVAGMGDAGVAASLDAASAYWNPASIAFVKKIQIRTEGALLYGGLSKHGAVALQVPVQQDIHVGASYIPFFSDHIPQYDTLQGAYDERLENPALRSSGQPTQYFRNNQHIVTLTVAKLFALGINRSSGIGRFPLPLDIGVGCNFKSFWQTISPGDKVRMGININCDAGILVRLGLDYDLKQKAVNREIRLGVSIRNALPTKIVWVHSPYNYEEPVYNTQHYGISYRDLSGFLWGNWIVSLAMHRSLIEGGNRHDNDGEGMAEYTQTWHAGIEGEFWDLVAFRGGISNRIPTLGAGVRYKRYSLDYSFRFDRIEYSPIRVALAISF
ncbi:MAG: hypothetical protein GF401_19970 [Chitinivibrionales bacterium]|nr:hypothetical protein [Chitinivibrionales bacterium]